MNPVSVSVVLAEAVLAANVPLWMLYSHYPLGAVIAVALMAMTWQLHKWSRP